MNTAARITDSDQAAIAFHNFVAFMAETSLGIPDLDRLISLLASAEADDDEDERMISAALRFAHARRRELAEEWSSAAFCDGLRSIVAEADAIG